MPHQDNGARQAISTSWQRQGSRVEGDRGRCGFASRNAPMTPGLFVSTISGVGIRSMGDSANSEDSETKLVPVDVDRLLPEAERGSEVDELLASTRAPSGAHEETTLVHDVPSDLLEAATA